MGELRSLSLNAAIGELHLRFMKQQRPFYMLTNKDKSGIRLNSGGVPVNTHVKVSCVTTDVCTANKQYALGTGNGMSLVSSFRSSNFSLSVGKQLLQ